MSVASSREPRYCRRGTRCVSHCVLGQPAKLRTTSTDDVCEACRKADAGAENGPRPRPSVEAPQEYVTLLEVARALFDSGEEDENKIIPTLVFAANLRRLESLAQSRTVLTKSKKRDVQWNEISEQVVSLFGGLVVPTKEVVDGMPILRQPPFSVTGSARDAKGKVTEVTLDVPRRAVKPDEVAEWYGRYLRLQGVPHDEAQGEIAWKFYDEGLLRMFARPQTRAFDNADGRFLEVPEGPRCLPDPRILAGVFEVLRPRFVSHLSGRQKGVPPKPDNLIPACVAWYMGGRRPGGVANKDKRGVAKVINEHLFKPCDKETLPEDGWTSGNAIWRNATNIAPELQRLENALRARA